MSNNWSKEDKNSFEGSEVMVEMEKSLINTLKRLEIISEKRSVASAVEAPDPSVKKNVDDLKNSVDNLADSFKNLSDAAADDDELEDSDEEIKLAVLSDLREMVKNAVDSGDIQLAYKIERTIGEILEEE